MSVTNITAENFNTEVLESEKPVLLDFWAAAAALRLPTLRPCVRHWMPCRKHCLQPRQQQSPLPQSRRWKKTMPFCAS